MVPQSVSRKPVIICFGFKDSGLAGNKKCLFGFYWLAGSDYFRTYGINGPSGNLEMEGDFERRRC